nr:unnamed protein product [Callosobruchus chinensis]
MSPNREDLNQSQNQEEDEEGVDTVDREAETSGFIKPPEPPRKRVRKHLDNRKSDNEDISQAIKQLDCIANNAAMDKPYDLFGRYVASELRQLPKREAILLQQNIQNSITQAELDMLDKPSAHQELVDIPLLSHKSTATDSSNDEEDILQSALINTFSHVV